MLSSHGKKSDHWTMLNSNNIFINFLKPTKVFHFRTYSASDLLMLEIKGDLNGLQSCISPTVQIHSMFWGSLNEITMILSKKILYNSLNCDCIMLTNVA